jgi:signal peptidase II
MRSSTNMHSPTNMRKWLALAAMIVVLDQLTKYFIVQKFALHESLYITSFFNLVYVRNTGAAFSMLADAGGWQRVFFIVVAVVASVWVVWLLKRHPEQKLFCLALGMILGGAVGNLIDRVLYGSVVDFVQMHYAGWYFPAFNVADSAITVGAGLMIWDALRPQQPQQDTTAGNT